MSFGLSRLPTDHKKGLEAAIPTNGCEVVCEEQRYVAGVDSRTRALRAARHEDDDAMVSVARCSGSLLGAHACQHYDDARRIVDVNVSAVPSGTAAAYRSPVLNRPGAVDAIDSAPDVGVPFHYGDPLGEQRAAASGFAVVDRSHRNVGTIGGAERVTWLEGFVSQHVSELTDRTGGETLVLDANGRVEHHAVLSDVDGTLYVDTEGGRGEPLLTFLTRMVFWADATPAAADLAVVTLVGTALPTALTAPDGTSVDLPTGDYASVPLPGGGVARRMPWPLNGSVDLLVPRSSLTAWFDAAVTAGARPAGMWAFEALRAGESTPPRARLGVDTDEKTIPHEVPTWIGDIAQHGAVHLEKGCYRGQETVSRVHNLGKSPRVLVRLLLDGSAGDSLPTAGTEVLSGGRTVGRIGTVVQHHEEGPIALALLKRAAAGGAELEVDGISVTVDPETAPGDTGPQAGREAVRKLRGQG